MITGQAIALPIAAIISVIAAGAWLGFSSCGGYVWHSYLGYAVLSLAVMGVLLGSASLRSRVGLTVVVVAAFLVARGAGFAAYLGAGSPGEYLRQFGSTFSAGLC